MSERNREIYEFGEFRLNVTERFLVRSADGERVPLSEKAFETLCVLVRNDGHLVSKNELFNRVWAESFVEENNLNKCIHALRRALGEQPGERQFIETIKKHGFRFVAEVRRVESEETADAVHQGNEFQLKTNGNRSAEFLQLFEQAETQRSGAVVAMADWRRGANGNEADEQVSPSFTPEESKQTVRSKSVSAKSNSESKSAPEYRLPLAAFALAAFLIGASVLGYYFYSGKRVSTSADGKKSIAVLPLKPISTANRDEIYEIGIADSLIHRLGSLKGFIVRPLSATRKYTDVNQDALAAGREQQVDYVLASNYQLVNGKIRVTSQLFNMANGQIEETYKSEEEAGDLFGMQDAIASEVGNKLQARFALISSSPKGVRGTTNEEAYQLYLQGRNLTARYSPTNLQKAVEYFEQAVRLDPNFARGYSGMAHAYILSGFRGGEVPRVENEKAKEAVAKALKLDDNLAEGYAVRGQLKLISERDFAGAEKDLVTAIELEPNNDLAHWIYALSMVYRGRFDEALAKIDTALAIDPGSPFYQKERGRFLYYARRYDEAIVQLRRVIELDENSGTAWGNLWAAYEMKGDDAGAYETFMKRQKQSNPERLKIYQKAYETAGWQGVRRRLLEFSKQDEQKPGSNLFAIARQCALLGEKEQAFEYLNKAFEKHQNHMIMLNVEPALDSLRGDPRFDELVRRIGLK